MVSSGANMDARPELHKTLQDTEVHMLEDQNLTD